MSEFLPVKPIYTGTDVTALGEAQPEDVMLAPGGGVKFPDGSVQLTAAGPAPDVSQFVQKSGDTMTGPLQVTNGGVTTQIKSDANRGYVGTVSNHGFALITNNIERANIDASGMSVSGWVGASGGFVNQTRGDVTNAKISISNAANANDANGDVTISGYYPIVFRTELSAERARFTRAGNFCLGTDSDLSSKLNIYSGVQSGITQLLNDGGGTLQRYLVGSVGNVVGFITTDGLSTTYATTSDYRLKENVAPMTGALSLVAALKPCTYTWKKNGAPSQGFIAHELQEILPAAVTGEKDKVESIGNVVDSEGKVVQEGVIEPNESLRSETWVKTGERPVYQGIDTSFLVATLVAAIQELSAKVAALEAK